MVRRDGSNPARFHIASPIATRNGYLCAFRREHPYVGGTASGPTADAARASAMQLVREVLAADARMGGVVGRVEAGDGR